MILESAWKLIVLAEETHWRTEEMHWRTGSAETSVDSGFQAVFKYVTGYVFGMPAGTGRQRSTRDAPPWRTGLRDRQRMDGRGRHGGRPDWPAVAEAMA